MSYPNTPDPKLPPLVPEGPRRAMLVTIEVGANFENRLDNQWEVEREIKADRWTWTWKDDAARPASPALARLKEEIERCPHSNECKANCHRLNRVAGKDYTCTCFKSRALRIIEELKHE